MEKKKFDPEVAGSIAAEKREEIVGVAQALDDQEFLELV